LCRVRVMSVRLVVVVLAAATLAAASVARSSSAGPRVLTVPLLERNGSGQSGTVKLTVVPKKGKVAAHFVVRLNVSPAAGKYGVAMFAHIHNVSCAQFGAMTDKSKQLATIAIGLNGLAGGRSTTTLYLPLARYANGTSSINVHASDDTYTVVACGDIQKVTP